MIWFLTSIAVGLSAFLASEDGLFVDGVEFTNPTASPIYGVKGGKKLLSWTYIIRSGETLTRIDCGHNNADKTNLVSLVHRTSTGTLTPKGSTTNKVTITENQVPSPGNPTIISFEINSLDDNDKHDYFCQLNWNLNTVPQQTLTSKKYLLRLLEKPQFLTCLRIPTIEDGQAPIHTTATPQVENGKITNSLTVTVPYGVDEGANITSQCIVLGDPIPTLVCRLYERISSTDTIISSIPRGGSAEQKNVTINFTGVRKTYSKVVCIADGVNAGALQITRNIEVYYRPNPIRNLKLKSSTTSSITVQWLWPVLVYNKIVGNLPYTAVYVERKKSSETDSSYTGFNVSTLPLPMSYEIRSLESGVKYDIRVRLFNRMGEYNAINYNCLTDENVGKSCLTRVDAIFKEPDSGKRKDDSSSQNLIIGLVVGGLVLFIIIIIIVVVCYKKRQGGGNKYPTSYVEEAVDYPAGPKLYANVDKSAKKPPSIDQRSTSGYPDIIHQANRPDVRYTSVNGRESEVEMSRPSDNRSVASNGSAAYRGHPQNEEDTMSPSYEDSRKEYV